MPAAEDGDEIRGQLASAERDAAVLLAEQRQEYLHLSHLGGNALVDRV